MRVVILQPGYLPWLGFFDQMIRSDVFVYYDDVQFDKHGWRNRNRIKTAAGPTWLTVPVLAGGRHGQRILDVEIDNRTGWARKQASSIAQSYSRAPYTKRFLPELEELLTRKWERLVDLDIETTGLLCRWLGLERKIVRASALRIEGGQSERLLAICQHFGADRYLSGDSAKDYLDVPMFADAGISVEWQSYHHPTYAQLHGEFLPYMSVVDLVLNVGPEALTVLSGSSPNAPDRGAEIVEGNA